MTKKDENKFEVSSREGLLSILLCFVIGNGTGSFFFSTGTDKAAFSNRLTRIERQIEKIERNLEEQSKHLRDMEILKKIKEGSKK